MILIASEEVNIEFDIPTSFKMAPNLKRNNPDLTIAKPNMTNLKRC